MSRTPAVSTPVKEDVLVQSDAALAGGLPFRNTPLKMCVLVAEVACDMVQDNEPLSGTPVDPKDHENSESDDDAVCDTPPPALVKPKVQLEQVLGASLQQKMNVDEESVVNQGSVGTPASSVTYCQLTKNPSTLKQKRPLG